MIVAYKDEYKQDFLNICQEMHEESRFSIYNISQDKLINLTKNPNCFVALSYKDKTPVGAFVGVVTEMWFSSDKAGYDLFVYVKPKNRGGMTAVRLIKKFEDFCKANNAKTINLGSSAEIATESAKRLYKKLGYKECGFLSHKEI